MSQHSKEFFELIRAIGEAKSKQEEDKIILKEIATLKMGMEHRQVTLKMMKEYMVRLLYCEMLGHDASFGHINAIKLTSSKDMLEKRVGYLAVTLCVPPDHELLLLLIANIQNDMKSTNFISICCALNAAVKIVNEELIPAVLPQILELRKHPKPIVKKKAIMAIHRFYQISPSSVPDVIEIAKDALCDRDPSVMGASLCLIHELCLNQQNIPQLKSLVSGFVPILKQVIERKLPREFDYHRLPAPWIQIKLLKILAIIGADDKNVSEVMYGVLREGMQRADTGLNIGHAVVFEYVKTVTSIYPNGLLLESASSAISRFVTSSNHNLKYLGIQALTQIVKINPKYATQHQMVVIDCLEDNDETLRRRTLELLFTMTNSNNVMVVVKRLLDFSKKTIDLVLRKELIEKISILAKNFSPNISWYLDTMNSLFEIDPQYIPQAAIQNMMSVIGEGIGDEDQDAEMRVHCVTTFCDVIDRKPVIHDLHIQVIAWVLGEYSYMSEEHPPEEIISRLCDLIERQLEFEETRCWIITAMMKIVAQKREAPEEVQDIIKKYRYSKNVDLQQRCYEFGALIEACNYHNWDDIMEAVLPFDGAYEDIEVDAILSCTDDYVEKLLKGGASRYIKSEEKQRIMAAEGIKSVQPIRVDAYPHHSKVVPNAINVGVATTTPKEVIENRSISTSVNNNTSELNIAFPRKNRKGNSMWMDETKIQAEEEQNNSGRISPSKIITNNSTSVTTAPISTSPQPQEDFQSNIKPKQPQPVEEKKKVSKSLLKIFEEPSGNNPEGKKQPTKTKIVTVPKKQPVRPRKSSKGPLNQPVIQQEEKRLTPPPQHQQQSLSIDDLFDSMGSNPVSQPIQPIQSTPKQSGGDLFDFFDNSTPVETKQPTPKQDNLMLFDTSDILQPSKGIKPISPTVTHHEVLQPLTKGKKTSYMISQLAAKHPSAFTDCIQLCKDELLSVDYNKYWKDDSLIIALLLSTDRGYTLSQVNCHFSAPSKFEVKISSDSDAKVQRNDNISFAKLDPIKPITVVITLTLQDITMGTRLIGRISYNDNQNTVQYLNIDAPINVIDVITPYTNLTTTDFSKLWKKFTQQKGANVKINGPFDQNRFMEIIKQKAKVFIVDVAGNEVITAAKLIGREDPVMLHFRFAQQTGTIHINAKSGDPTLTTNALNMASSIF
ncbi:hypothetical protein ABK040_016753 [Willaertia magna]